MTYTWQECNSGNATAGMYRIRVYLDGVEVYTNTRQQLAAGVCFISEPVTRVAGKGGTWRVYVDTDQQVNESYEGNNDVYYGYGLSLDPGPDPEPDPGPDPCAGLSTTPTDATPSLRRRPNCDG